MALLEQRKKQLAAEGLFDESRKKPRPFLPEVIGVVTSPTGAVIRDILHRLSDRFPCHVLVWPVLVQGEGAAEQIAAAINGFNALAEGSAGQDAQPEALAASERKTIIPSPDLIIVARGGGSLEDLWAFNEEIVVRATANSEIPLISAVGHETDTTLIDYAADLRAPTPTAAAELAVPQRSDCMATLEEFLHRLRQAARQRLQREDERISGLARGLPRPADLLQQATQKLDDWTERLGAALPRLIRQKHESLAHLTTRLRPQMLQRERERYAQELTRLAQQLTTAITARLNNREQALLTPAKLLETLNYKQVLKRGFVLVKDKNDRLKTLTFHDGEIPAIAAGKGKGNQGELF